MGRYCLVPSCKSGLKGTGKDNVIVHTVPKDPDLAKLWIQATRRENIIKAENTGVCSLHFLSEDYVRDLHFELTNPDKNPMDNERRRLKEDAVPSQNIPGCASKTRPVGALSAIKERRDIVDAVTSERLLSALDVSPPPGPGCSCAHPGEVTQLFKKIADLEGTIKQMTAELDAKDAEVKALYRDKLKVLLTDQQIDALLDQKRPCPWDDDTVHRALLYRTRLSRSQYEFLRDHGMPLPSLTTLKSRLRKVAINQGDTSFSTAIIQEYLRDKPSTEKPCVLMFDEMKVTNIGDFDPTCEQIIGPANNLQQVMLRSIVGSWKIPLFFDFDTPMTKHLLEKLVMDVEAAGAQVVAVVSDLGGANRGLRTALGIQHDSVTHFMNPADTRRKVWVFADTPHLYKLLRNHLLDNGLDLPGKGFIDAKLFADVLAIDRDNEFRILPKLGTESHLLVTGQARQKVRPAVQLVSASVATAVDTFLSRREEAYYLRTFDNGFDALNGQCPTDVKPLRRGIGSDSPAHDRALSELDAAVRLKLRTKKDLQPFQKGFIVNIQSMRGLVGDLLPMLGPGAYILPGRINQDILESFFGLVRAKGGANLHPSPSEAKCRVRSLTLMYALRMGVNPLTLTLLSDRAVTDEDSAVDQALLADTLKERPVDSGEVSSEMEEIRSLVEAASQRRPKPPTAASSPIDPTTGVSAEQYGMAHAAGYISAKCRKVDPTLGVPSSFAGETALAETMWTRLLSQGGLSVPSAEWMEQFRVLDRAFCIHHHLAPDGLSREPGVIESVVRSVMEQNPDLPDVRVVRRFVRLRTFIRLSSVNRHGRTAKAQAAAIREAKKKKQFAS